MLRLSFLIILFFLEQLSFSQKNKIQFTADLKKCPFPEFVKELEKQCGVRIFYLNTNPDTISVTISCRNMPVDSLLLQVLRKAAVNSFITSDNDIILSDIKITGYFARKYYENEKTVDSDIPVQLPEINKQKVVKPEEPAKTDIPGIKYYIIGKPQESKNCNYLRVDHKQMGKLNVFGKQLK